MRVQMIGHAALICETEDARILTDPWIVGPSNFRSWWHIPEMSTDVASLPSLDYIYISHLHGDHFHLETLKALSQRPTVLVPRLYHGRMLERLHELGYTRVQELRHGQEVRLRGQTRVTCMHVGNDSLLAVADGSGAMLNANDALQSTSPKITDAALRQLGQRYRWDIAFLAFGTAGPFPKCYRFEDPAEGIDPARKERAMLGNFVEGARKTGAPLVVPFAGNFALLADRLLGMNDIKTTPVDALGALRARDPDIAGVEMNPGDLWDTRRGLDRVHPGVDWDDRLEMIRRMARTHAEELRRIDEEEQRGPDDLFELFRRRLTQNLRTLPFLRRKLDCSVLFDVLGEPGGQWEVDLRRSPVGFREGDSGQWAIRLTIPSGLLAAVLTDPDGWETLGISYKLDLYFRKGARAKEAAFTRLINTPSIGWAVRTMCSRRFLDLLVRRRAEFSAMLHEKLSA